ncbi:MAG: diaminopimelate epimerase [Thermodesulfobacteriota bacterium]
MTGGGIEFYKLSGHGNDFIFVDNRAGQVAAADMPALARAACRRHFGVGADGLIFIVNPPADVTVDFAWRFFNNDGSEADMCGNASRCAARYAYLTGLAPARLKFLTRAGVIGAEVLPQTVKIELTQPSAPEMDDLLEVDGQNLLFCSINTGVPHAVTFVPDVAAVEVVKTGRAVRYHPRYQPAGTNVNFVEKKGENLLAVRTYERGVEDETLACGTGVTAAVLLSALKGEVTSPTRILPRGGEELLIHFTRRGDVFTDVFLEGPVRVICHGRLGPDIMRD